MQVENDQFKRYCNASIIDYLKAKKIPFESNGKEGYFHLVDHDSLVVVEEGTGHYKHDTFFWNSRGLQGNLYHFITDYMGIPKGKFVDEVIATLGEDAAPKNDQAGEQEEDFDASQFPDCGYHQQVTDVLMEQVGLSQALVDRLFDLDMVRQLNNGEGILMWRDVAGNIVGGSQLFIRTDETTTTRTSRGSKHYYGFNFGYHYQQGHDYQLLVFEDPLRALAYYQMLTKTNDAGAYRFLSVGGAGTRLPAIDNYVQMWGFPQSIRLCLDNNDAGLIMGAKFYNNYGGHDDMVNVLDKDDHPVAVGVAFDHPQDDQPNFVSQNLNGGGELRAETYQEFLDDYDASHQSGAAQHLIETTPGIERPQTNTPNNDDYPVNMMPDLDSLVDTTDDLPF